MNGPQDILAAARVRLVRLAAQLEADRRDLVLHAEVGGAESEEWTEGARRLDAAIAATRRALGAIVDTSPGCDGNVLRPSTQQGQQESHEQRQ